MADVPRLRTPLEACVSISLSSENHRLRCIIHVIHLDSFQLFMDLGSVENSIEISLNDKITQLRQRKRLGGPRSYHQDLARVSISPTPSSLCIFGLNL